MGKYSDLGEWPVEFRILENLIFAGPSSDLSTF